MGTKVQYLTVVLEEPMTSEDADTLAKSIQAMRNVQTVVQGEPLGVQDFVTRSRVRHQLLHEVFEMIRKSD